MHKLEQHVLKNWPLSIKGTLAVGLSGGIDSVVLLHILKSLQEHKDFKLQTLHVNHGISPKANTWEKFCQKQCNLIGVELSIHRTTITKNGGESLENNARIARYNYFLNSNSKVIVLAHHKKDQVETVLSQILRGNDVHNIASMKIQSQKQDKIIWRPLLDISKDMITKYATEFNLSYITDESNSDTAYLRNFIRLRVLPLLLEFDKDVEGKILKLPNHLQDILAIVDEVTADDLELLLNNNSINLDKFKELSLKRQSQVITYYIKLQNLALPTTKQINEFIRQALESKWDKEPSLLLNQKYQLVKIKNLIKIKESV